MYNLCKITENRRVEHIVSAFVGVLNILTIC